MTQKLSMRFFNDHEVRAVWDETKSKWWFAIVDMIAVRHEQSDHARNRNYWTCLKNKLSKDNPELVSTANQLKLTAPDGKLRLTDRIDAREMFMKGIDYSYYYESGSDEPPETGDRK